MTMISELASASIKRDKKDTLATRLSIFLAVLLLGTITVITASMRADEYHEIVAGTGDYQLSISGIDEKMYDTLVKEENIRQLSFDRLLATDLGASIEEKGEYYWKSGGPATISGRKPARDGELLVPSRFLLKNKACKLGSTLTANHKTYTIVGSYEDHGYSFEEPIFMGYLSDLTKKNLLEGDSFLTAYLWFENPRDTYPAARELVKKLNIDEKTAESSGRLSFNKDILEHKMIYPGGIFPPKRVVAKAAETYLPLLLLSSLFAVMIYGAFNVWNNRNIREIALLKSVGMTERQLKKMIRMKAWKLSFFPILFGTISAYLVANLLRYLMWANNARTYSHLSTLFQKKVLAPDFQLMLPSLPLVLFILLLSFFTVFLSALLPARRSAKINIIEGLNGNTGQKTKSRPVKNKGRIENSLARTYYRSYRSSYLPILLAMLISANVSTSILATQSYRGMQEKYEHFQDPYAYSAQIYTAATLDPALMNDLKQIKGWDAFYIYRSQDFAFSPADNKTLLSQELQRAIKEGRKEKDDLYVRLYGLSDADFQALLKKEGIKGPASCLLLNTIAADNKTPYAFRKYIPITAGKGQSIQLKYGAGGVITLPIDGDISDFPYDWEGKEKNGIFLFTPLSRLDALIEKYGQDEEGPRSHYSIRGKAEKNLSQVAEECEKLIAAYIPKSDYQSTTAILQEAVHREEKSNTTLLNTGIQIILLIIALSNAYNSFHGNLRSRKRDFQILSTTGMTEKQIKRMVLSEGRILFRKTLLAYLLTFLLVISIRAWHSPFAFTFAVKEIAQQLNYLPIILIFLIMASGILLATHSGLKEIGREDLNPAMRERE